MNYGFVVVHLNCPGIPRVPGEPAYPPKFMLEMQDDTADRGTDLVLVCPACDHKVVLNFREVCDNPAAAELLEASKPKEIVPI